MNLRSHTARLITTTAALLVAGTIAIHWQLTPSGSGGPLPARTFTGDTVTIAIAIDDKPLTPEGLVAGLNVALIERCADADSFAVRLVRPYPGDSVRDSLAAGRYDLAVMEADSLGGAPLVSFPAAGEGVVWALAPSHGSKADSLRSWMEAFMETEDYAAERQRFTCVRTPRKVFDKGWRISRISPYDAEIRAAARQLQWDWRLLSALIFTESKFSITAESRRGAFGLMQIMPQEGQRDVLLDPSVSLQRGTRHIRGLQRTFRELGIESEEDLDRIVVAAYNAGEGRLQDCMSLAELKGLDPTRWENIRSIIPLMAENADSIDAIAQGRFRGRETLAYVDSVFTHFAFYLEILR